MKVICPKCGMSVEKTTELVRSHIRHKHPKLTDNSKAVLRRKMVADATESIYTKQPSTYELENFYKKQTGI
jgi:hypothetical protein